LPAFPDDTDPGPERELFGMLAADYVQHSNSGGGGLARTETAMFDSGADVIERDDFCSLRSHRLAASQDAGQLFWVVGTGRCQGFSRRLSA